VNIRPEAAELFHTVGQTDRQTDMTTYMVAARNFVMLRKVGAIETTLSVDVGGNFGRRLNIFKVF